MLINIKKYIIHFIYKFSEYIFNNLYIIFVLYTFRKHVRNLISKEKYNELKPLLKIRYVKFNTTYMSDIFSLSDEEVKYYMTVLNNLPTYEKLTISNFLELIYECGFIFDEEDVYTYYDGFDIGRHVLYKPLIGKRKIFKIINKNEKYVFTLENGREINLLFFNFLFYTPISPANKRKMLIKNLK